MRLVAGRYVDDTADPVETLGSVAPERPPSEWRRRVVVVATLLAVGLAGAVVGGAWASRTSQPEPREQGAIDLVAAYRQAWSDNDADAVLRLMASGATLAGNGVLGGDALALQGDALTTHVRDVLSTRDLVVESTGPAQVRLDGDDALVTTPNRLSYRTTGGGTPLVVTGSFLVSVHDFGGSWRVTSDTWVEDGFLGRSGRHAPEVAYARSCRGIRAPAAPATQSTGPTIATTTALDPSTSTLIGIDGVHTWRFDLCRLTWVLSRSRTTPLPANLAMTDVAARDGSGSIVSVVAHNGVPWTFHPVADVWSSGEATSTLWDPFRELLLAYDSRGGVVMALDHRALEGSGRWWAFDPVGGVWHRIPEVDAATDGPSGDAEAVGLAYDEGTDRLVTVWRPVDPDFGPSGELVTGGTGLQTWLFDPRSRRWSRGAEAPLGVTIMTWSFAPLATAVDPIDGLILASDGRRLARYDAVVDRWTSVPATMLPQAIRGGKAIVTGLEADPGNNRIIALVAQQSGDFWWTGPPQVWAVDIAAGRWTRLS